LVERKIEGPFLVLSRPFFIFFCQTFLVRLRVEAG